MSVEILIALLAIQNTHKDGVLILRGDHETSVMNRKYGFEAEVLKKYNREVLRKFHLWFRTFPFAAVIDYSVFVCHGGLGPHSHQMTIAELNVLSRFREPVPKTPMFELMWCGKSSSARHMCFSAFS
jgi:serine/threonine-protein phosphatase 5